MENSKLAIVIAIFYVYLIQHHGAWLSGVMPKIYGDKIPQKSILPTSKKIQHKIVSYHNLFRSLVQPPASDMLAMTWHEGAAKAAQRWANRCLDLNHDSPTGLWIKNFGSCGQNIFISTHRVPWFFVIKMWFMEKKKFSYGSPYNLLHSVGHYTQLVWSTTHKVGCGFTHCQNPYSGRPYFSYICNYCPTGNYADKLGTPYEAGKRCSKCPKHCVKKLCRNPCPAVDMWANCNELYKTFPSWLCHTHTPKGKQRRKYCKATCTCQNQIK
ncbi:cysteine-rich venom protein-like [Lycorma delicatula]|uniref:cysteine-rich venom protein-like n=1 Tax=Lycorma delicatula TaxID=130591 RepID=UPI003F50F1C9